ncbi:MAG: hypothetical protein H6710_16590 [Myxococcales bacterium]|nr:hypothetical protein [Myxococcales bacterium]MCB9706546.1 hypothetical protein [Myxococcales bacterium]
MADLRALAPWILALLIGAPGCVGDDAATSAGCDDPPELVIDNGTPWTLAGIEYRPCGSADPDESFPFPPPGLPPGEQFTVALTGPGCFEVQVDEASGCSLDPRVSTGDLAACASKSVHLDEAMFGCPGG